MKLKIMSVMQGASVAVLAGAVGLMGFRFVRADVEAEAYRERLEELGGAYDTLATRFNDAVRQTAVTELVVAGSTITVRVRSFAGVEREIATPFDPSGEVYLDYVVVDGRLWIRRIFDEHTAPTDAVVIEPEFSDVDWDSPEADHGKAVYRRLSEGRWVATVTGGGSLGLRRAREGELVALESAPAVRSYEQIVEQVSDPARELGAGEVLRRAVGLE